MVLSINPKALVGKRIMIMSVEELKTLRKWSVICKRHCAFTHADATLSKNIYSVLSELEKE